MKGRERFSQVPGVAWTFLCTECDCLKWFPEECFQKETALWGKAGIVQPLPLRARNTLTLLPRETHPSQPKATLKGARAKEEVHPNNNICGRLWKGPHTSLLRLRDCPGELWGNNTRFELTAWALRKREYRKLKDGKQRFENGPSRVSRPLNEGAQTLCRQEMWVRSPSTITQSTLSDLLKYAWINSYLTNAY